jgi:hypothetical protein
MTFTYLLPAAGYYPPEKRRGVAVPAALHPWVRRAESSIALTSPMQAPRGRSSSMDRSRGLHCFFDCVHGSAAMDRIRAACLIAPHLRSSEPPLTFDHGSVKRCKAPITTSIQVPLSYGHQGVYHHTSKATPLLRSSGCPKQHRRWVPLSYGHQGPQHRWRTRLRSASAPLIRSLEHGSICIASN